MKFATKGLEISVVSDLYRAGPTEDGGDHVAERYQVAALVKADGRTFRLSHFWMGAKLSNNDDDGLNYIDMRPQAKAAAEADADGFRALAEIDFKMIGSKANPEAVWHEAEPSYGSTRWQELDGAEGQAARFDRSLALKRAGEVDDHDESRLPILF